MSRSFVRSAVLAWCMVMAWGPAIAQEGVSVASACAPYQGRKLSLVLSVKPGGGFDMMARALEPVLARHSGMSVAVSNVTGGHGALALRAILSAKSDRPAVGLIDLGGVATQMVNDPAAAPLSHLVGLGLMSTDHTVWVSRQPVAWAQASGRALTGATTTSPYVRLGLPAELLGLDLKPIFGFEGTNQVWLALLRGDVDVVTMSDQTAQRNLATGAKAAVSLALTVGPHPDFPGVPYLAGPGGLVDARTQGLSPVERKRQMGLALLAVMLSEQARTLVASAKLQPAVLACLRQATEAALRDPVLLDAAERQKFGLAPEGAQAAHHKMQQVARALKDNLAYLRSIAQAWQVGQ